MSPSREHNGIIACARQTRGGEKVIDNPTRRVFLATHPSIDSQDCCHFRLLALSRQPMYVCVLAESFGAPAAKKKRAQSRKVLEFLLCACGNQGDASLS